MSSQWMFILACVVVGLPLAFGLCLLNVVLFLRLAKPSAVILIDALHDVRDREHEFALARMDRQIELARANNARN